MVYKRSSSSRQPKRSYVPFVLAATVLLLVILGLFLYATHRLPFLSHNTKAPVTHSNAGTSTKGEQGPDGSSDQSGNNDTKNNNNQSTGTLIAPTNGSNFVSAHHGIHPTDTLSSTCTTTPGATCEITFTKDTEAHSLGSETTDAGGTAYWNGWHPSDYDLTEGNWTVTAVAKLGNQTLSTTDATQLEIVP